MNRKYQVFISSTFLDLKEERREAIESVLELQHIPSGMEAFPAVDLDQLKYIRKLIDQCDYYVLVIGGRYGSLNAEGVSFTEAEYDYAVAEGKHVLVFPHADLDSIPRGKTDVDERAMARLEAFREKSMRGRLASTWTTKEELRSKVIVALSNAFAEHPQIGWVRADTAAQVDTLEKINAANETIEKLRADLANARASIPRPPADLMVLEDVYDLNYTHTDFSYPTNTHVKVPWEVIFKAVGPTFVAPRVPGLTEYALINLVKKLRNHNTILVQSFVWEEVFLHLQALGLIDSEAAEKVGGGVSAFAQLTPAGRAMLKAVGGIRRPSQQTMTDTPAA